MVGPAQLEVHGVHIVLQSDEIEAAPVLAIAEDIMDRLVVQPFGEVIEPGGGLTARGWTRTLRLARTIADLDGCTGVLRRHIAEALIYRRNTVGAEADFDRRVAARDTAFGMREDDAEQAPFLHS